VQPARVGVLGAGEGSGKGFFVSASHTWQESEVVWPRAKVGRGGAAARPQQQGWGPGGGSAGHTWQEPEAGVLGEGGGGAGRLPGQAVRGFYYVVYSTC
jgi:hypothetical protein